MLDALIFRLRRMYHRLRFKTLRRVWVWPETLCLDPDRVFGPLMCCNLGFTLETRGLTHHTMDIFSKEVSVGNCRSYESILGGGMSWGACGKGC